MTRPETEAIASATLIAAQWEDPIPMESAHGSRAEAAGVAVTLARLPDGWWRANITTGALRLGGGFNEDPAIALAVAKSNAQAALRRLTSVLL
jgi:hypothetical protein